ncbi:hypothetical protein MRX96_022245 [Rhipicephalus microplus]
MLVVKDLDFLTYIFVKNFKNFTDRGMLMRTDQEHTVLRNSIINAKGAQWKRTRGCISQAFTSSKLKQVMPHLTESADLFLETLGGAWQTLDESWRSTNPFKAAREVIHGVQTGPFHMIAHCTSTLPAIASPILWLNEKLGSFTFSTFGEETKKIVRMRLRNPEARKPDLLQIMLDASDKEDRQHNEDSKNRTSMTLQEVELNTTVNLIGGFETTSAAMAYVFYVLAKYQDIQEKVRADVASAVEEYGKINYDAITSRMKYLRSVLDETLRIYPPGTAFTTRRAINDFEYNGVKYKAGTSIMAPTFNIHMDPRYWPEPHKFDPERFFDENVASRACIAYQPFGAGPRNCVGERLAILAITYTVARVVQKYRLALGESQKKNLELHFYAGMSAPQNGPYLKFQRI